MPPYCGGWVGVDRPLDAALAGRHTPPRMETHSPAGRATTALLSILMASCGTSRHLASPRAEELTRFVLVIRELPDGTASHSWQRAEEVDLSQYRSSANPHSSRGRIVLAVSNPRDCDAELADCIQECMSRPLSKGFGHITSRDRKKGGKGDYCNRRCMQPYLDCSELKELQRQEFTAMDGAVDWLKRNHKSILVGSVVIIAGVAFIVVSAGAGLVVLTPAVLLATSATPPEVCIAGVPT